jgi:hypothetical protein
MTSSGLPDLSTATPVRDEVRIYGVFDATSCDFMEGTTAEFVGDLSVTTLPATALEPM